MYNIMYIVKCRYCKYVPISYVDKDSILRLMMPSSNMVTLFQRAFPAQCRGVPPD